MDHEFLNILKNNTIDRDNYNNKNNISLDIDLEDDLNYINDKRLIYVGNHSKIKIVKNKKSEETYALKMVKNYYNK